MKHLKRFNETYKEKNSTFGHDGKEYNLNKIFDYIETIPVVSINVSELDWILKYTNIYKKRVKQADIEVPIIIVKHDDQWVVVDGVHRLSKLKMLKHKVAQVKIIPNEFISLWEI